MTDGSSEASEVIPAVDSSDPSLASGAASAQLKAIHPDFELRILDAIRRGASMQDIAGLKPARVTTPEQAIRALKDGNARFFSNQASRPELGANERRAQIMGQTPFAVILACSDSRVPVELVFDQGFGDLFVIRVAGNVVGESGLGTVEYAVRHLDVRLIVVMGHEGCGAVQSALLPEADILCEPPALQKLIRRIQPSLEHLPAIRDKKARMREAVLNNVRHQAAHLRGQAVVREAEASGQIRVIGGFYEIGSGAVDFLIEDEDLLP
ncbi:carbonic anhydrase [Deinococcus sp.]|uniref:carbonic anhydrase n=1 Tax=Deinococcus sp. TaxID=47478 RepID=UPI003CC68565